MEAFDRLLDNHTVALFGAPILLVVIAVVLIRSWRAVRRGDPIRTMLWPEPITRDNPFYALFVIRLRGVTGAFLFVVLPLALLVLVAMIMSYLQR